MGKLTGTKWYSSDDMADNHKVNPALPNPTDSNISTRIDIASSELETPSGIVRSLTVTAFHAGNWQKPIGPEDTKVWVEAIKSLIQREVTKARIDEIERAKNRKRIFDYYDDRIAQLSKKPTHTGSDDKHTTISPADIEFYK